MPVAVDTQGNTQPPEDVGDVIGGAIGKVGKTISDALDNKISAAEQASMGTFPTELVFAAALTTADSREAARMAALVARHLDLPTPPPLRRGRERKPEPIIDPYTGDVLSLRRAEQLYSLGQNLAAAFTATPPGRRRRPVDPNLVFGYVRAMDSATDVRADFALTWAMDMAKHNTDPVRFNVNLQAIQRWNDDTNTITEEDALIYARWWTENRDTTITPGNIVNLVDPDITAAIIDRRADSIKGYDLPEGITAPVSIVGARELEQLIDLRAAALEDASKLKDAQRILGQMEAPTWIDRGVAWAGAQLEDLWHVSQHIAVDAATLPVLAIREVAAAVPGGSTFEEAYHKTLKDRSYLIQRVNGGDSLGQVLITEQYNAPPWVGVAFDLAVGWKLDPFVVAGKLQQGRRATRLLPGLTEPSTLRRVLTPQRILNWEARLQYNNFGGSVLAFSRSRDARKLFDAAYDSDTALFRGIDRLASSVEARSALEYEFLRTARAGLLAKYPRANEQAWLEWQNIMRAHFGIQPPPGSVAEAVVRARQGAIDVSAARTMEATATQTGEGLVISGSRIADDVIDEATTALAMRAEVPHRLLPVPGLGARRLASLKFAESRLGQTRVGRGARTMFNANPGNIFRPGVDPEAFLFRRGTRWREFGEPELRQFQSEAAEIVASGVSTEARLRTLAEKMDSEAMRRILTKMGVPDERITDAIAQATFRSRSLQKAEAFGVLDEGASTLVRRAPLTESQLINEVVLMDPILVRKMFRRYVSTLREMEQGVSTVAPLAKGSLWTLDTSGEVMHTVMRTWKFAVVPRPAYIGRVVLGDENLRFLATTGSLMERIAAQEFKFLPKFVSRQLDETIGTGEHAITVSRAGTYSYEPLANQAFRDEELLDDLLRRTATHDKALRSLGAYGRIDPGDPQHLGVWMRALNLQLGNSVPGRLALQSVAAGDDVATTINKMRQWARSRDGYVTLRSRIGVETEGVEEWANFLGRMTHQYTAGRADLADLAIARGVGEDILNAIPNKPAVHGPLVEALTAAGGGANMGKRFVESWYRWFVRQPENILNRQPFYKVWKRRFDRGAYRMLEQQGIEVTADIKNAIDASSRNFALAQVKKIMFDFTENTRVGEMVAAVVPFSQPWAEAYTAWGHILLKRNPAMIGYVRNVWQAGIESGFIRKDGEDGPYVIPWSWTARAVSWLPWVHDEQLPPGLGLVAPVSSLNLFFSQNVEVAGLPIPAPGLAPWAAIPLKEFFADTENTALQSYLFGYGPDTPIVSSWMERAIRTLRPEQFTDNRETSSAQDFLRLYQYLGTDRDENGDLLPQNVLITRAREDARRVNGLLATTGFLAPTAGRITFPEGFEAKEAELAQFRESLGFEEGTDRFLQRNPELTLMTVGKTIYDRRLDGIEGPRIPASEEVAQLLNTPGFDNFAKRFPWAASALVLSADEQWDESSLEVFSQQVHDQAVKYKGLGRFLTEGQSEGFWRAVEAVGNWYYPLKDRFEGSGLGDDNAKVISLEQRRREALYDIYLRYPDEARRQGFVALLDGEGNENGQARWESTDNAPPPEVVHSSLRQMTEFDGFEEFPAIQGVTAYYQIRDQVARDMAKQGIDDIHSSTAERSGLEAVWETALASVNTEFPEAQPFISKFLDNDLTGIESRGDVKLRTMQQRNPERYDRYIEFDTTWENILDSATATAGLSSDEQNARYEAARDYANTVYETDPWMLRLWLEAKSYSGREAFKDTLLNRPPIFYSRFDWETMGVRITDSAAQKLDAIAGANEEIDARQAEAVRTGDDRFVSTPLHESVDAQARAWMRTDKSFAKAVGAINTWGWALWQPEAQLVTQKGKAGYAWQALQGVVGSINQQVIPLDLHGDGLAFGDIDDKRIWTLARDAVNDYIADLAAWSPVFEEQVADLQRGALRGTPLGEFLVPPIYFPLGGNG